MGTFCGNKITHSTQSGGNTIQTSGTDDYQYDGNGNMTLDALRNITLIYDIINLVSTVSRNDTLLATYHYLADGTKYKVIDPDNNGRVYIGPFSYTTAKSGNTVYSYLEGIDTDGGRIMVVRKQSGTQNTYDYTTAFFVRDHLGSIRTITDSQGNALERNDYYPYGLQTNLGRNYPELADKYRVRMPASFTVFSQNGSSYPAVSSPTGKFLPYRLLYNGKELQMVAQTRFVDYGARQYDPTIARWNGIDSLSEKYIGYSQYAYCLGNPINYYDKQGDTVYLYATMLPGSDWWVLKPATHTFIAVKHNGRIDCFAYGSEFDGFKGAFGGHLKQQDYPQDQMVASGKEYDKKKDKFIITPPDGMSYEDFDDKVIKTAKDYGDNNNIRYFFLPIFSDQGNCNTSSSTILYKAGIPIDRINEIKKQMKGLNWVFGNIKAWSKEEQEKAVKQSNYEKVAMLILLLIIINSPL